MIILNIEPNNYSKTAVIKLKKHFRYKEIKNYKAFPEKEKVYAVITRLKYKINKPFLNYFRNLKFILCNTTGIDHIDEEICKQKNIKILSLKNKKKFMKNINSTSELTFGLIISLLRKIPSAYNDVLKLKWRRNLFLGYDLYNSTLGIIGMGRNGLKIAKYAKAFGMKIQYFDKKKKNIKFRYKSLNTLLKTSNIIVCTVNYDISTHNLINERNIKLIKKNAYLINTSRANIICEKSLLQALKKKKIAGAALDVLRDEFDIKKSYQLINYARENNNLLITPHIGGANFDEWKLTENEVVDNFLKIHE